MSSIISMDSIKNLYNDVKPYAEKLGKKAVFHTEKLCGSLEGMAKPMKAIGVGLLALERSLKAADKTVEVVNNLSQIFGEASSVESLLGFIAPLTYFVVHNSEGKYAWRKDSIKKIASKAFGLVGKTAECLKALEGFKLVELGRISAKITFQAAASPAGKLVLAPLAVVKDLGTMGASFCNVLETLDVMDRDKEDFDEKITYERNSVEKWTMCKNDCGLESLKGKYTENRRVKDNVSADDRGKRQKYDAFYAILNENLDNNAAIMRLEQAKELLQQPVGDRQISSAETKAIHVLNRFIDELGKGEVDDFTQAYRNYCHLKVTHYEENEASLEKRTGAKRNKNILSIIYDVAKIALAFATLTAGVLALAACPYAVPVLLGLSYLGVGVAVFDLIKFVVSNGIDWAVGNSDEYKVHNNVGMPELPVTV
jgi:hypothetical protein